MLSCFGGSRRVFGFAVALLVCLCFARTGHCHFCSPKLRSLTWLIQLIQKQLNMSQVCRSSTLQSGVPQGAVLSPFCFECCCLVSLSHWIRDLIEHIHAFSLFLSLSPGRYKPVYGPPLKLSAPGSPPFAFCFPLCHPNNGRKQTIKMEMAEM